MIRTNVSGPAAQALAQQVEFFGGSRISLSSLWRVAGSPTGHDPRNWVRLAGPLVDGYGTYRTKLGPANADEPGAERVVWTWDGESKDPWHAGDLMSEQFVAMAYAIYLDKEIDAAYANHRASLD